MKWTMLLLVVFAASLASPFYGQQPTGSVTGRVLDKDGKTPLVGATVELVSWIRNVDGGLQERKRITTQTLPDGRYRFPEVPAGRTTITVFVDNQPVMVNRGNAIEVVAGRESVGDLDLSNVDKPPQRRK